MRSEKSGRQSAPQAMTVCHTDRCRSPSRENLQRMLPAPRVSCVKKTKRGDIITVLEICSAILFLRAPSSSHAAQRHREPLPRHLEQSQQTREACTSPSRSTWGGPVDKQARNNPLVASDSYTQIWA